MKGDRPPPNPKKVRRDAALAGLKEYQKGGLISGAFAGAAQITLRESDRGAIILTAGVIEDFLTERLLNALPGGIGNRDELTRQGGVLGTFQDRLTLAKTMGLIDDDVFDDIDTIRQLRNACAHTLKPVSLKVPAINAVFGALIDEVGAAAIAKEDTNPLALRMMLGIVMIYILERVAGNGHAKAQESADALMRRANEKLADELAKQQASPETPGE